MKQHWMWAWFPDLERVESLTDRWALWWKAYDPVMKRPAYWILAGAVQVGAQVIVGIPAARYIRSWNIPGPLREWGPPIVLAVLATVFIIWLWRRQITRNIRRRLTARGLPTCIRCGYDLRNLPADPDRGQTVCPECGRAWRLPGVEAEGSAADG